MLELRFGRFSLSASFWFLAGAGFFLWYERSVLVWYFAMPVIIHELGHMIAVYLCGAEITEIRLRLFGVDMVKRPELSYLREIWITLAGAGANLIAAAVLHAADFPTMRSMLLGACNLSVAAFNLLPVGDLDGGAIVRLLGERFGGAHTGRMLSKAVSFLVLVPLFAAAFRLLLQPEPNVTLLIACLYLAGVVIAQ